MAGAGGIDAVPGLEDALAALGIFGEVPSPSGGGDPLGALLGGLLGLLGLLGL